MESFSFLAGEIDRATVGAMDIIYSAGWAYFWEGTGRHAIYIIWCLLEAVDKSSMVVVAHYFEEFVEMVDFVFSQQSAYLLLLFWHTNSKILDYNYSFNIIILSIVDA